MKNKKGYLQIPFAWLFAIIVGAFILFLAIYGVTKLINVSQYELDTKTAKNLGVLLNPLETGFETGKTTSLTLPTETRIYNKCDLYGNFGNQIIQVSQKSFNKWPEPAGKVSFQNKYIFSEGYVEGKKFYIFSKPFDFPFKVSDLIYITSSLDKYCFLDAPEDIEDEILYLGQENFFVEDCPDDRINVCFRGGPNCDINVNYNIGEVERNNEKVYFEGDALMYAAVFSEKEIYECQLKRLMQRVGNLASVYRDKAVFISQTVGCHSNLNLLGLRDLANDLESSHNLASMNYIVEDIKNKNEANSECRLW